MPDHKTFAIIFSWCNTGFGVLLRPSTWSNYSTDRLRLSKRFISQHKSLYVQEMHHLNFADPYLDIAENVEIFDFEFMWRNIFSEFRHSSSFSSGFLWGEFCLISGFRCLLSFADGQIDFVSHLDLQDSYPHVGSWEISALLSSHIWILHLRLY